MVFFDNGTNEITTTQPQVNMRTGANTDPEMGSMLRIYCELTGKCETTTKNKQFMFAN